MSTAAKPVKEFSIDRAWDGPPDVTDTDEEKVQYVLARYAVQNDHYAGLYQQWVKPIYFLVGKQWIKWNEQNGSFTLDTDVPAWRQQPVTNFTFAVYRTLMAKMTKQRPTLEVVPPSGDSEDREAAKLGEAILEFLWRYLKSPQKVIRAIGWILATGNVAFDVDWDDDAGETRPRTCLVEMADPSGAVDETGQPATIDVDCACDENGEPLRREPAMEGETALDGGKPYDHEAEPDMESIGEIVFNVDDPLSYRWNPEATSSDDAEEMFIASMWPKARIATTFEVEPGDILSGGGEASDTREAVQNMLDSVTAASPDPFNSKGNNVGSRSLDNDSDRALVIKYYRKPDKDAPKGRHWITAGATKVWPPENDPEYPNGEAELPFGFWPPRVALIDTPIPGQPQGLGVLSQVVPLNEKYNYLDGKIGEYHVTSAMGGVIWVHPEDKGIKITSEPGQVKPSKGLALGFPPLREQLPALPAPVYEERSLIAANLNALAGVSQLDMGQRPEGVSAGRAFLVMQEASDSVIMPTLNALEDALEEVGRRQLIIAQQKYAEPRTIKIRGEKGKWEFHSFRGADLRDGLDVRVQAGSMAPWSKAAQWDGKMQVLTALPGLVTNPQTGEVDEEKLARILDSGVAGLKAFESENDADLEEIDREHAMFEVYDPTSPDKSNQLPQLAVWQNQAKHQKYHFEFMKRSLGRFEKWSDPAKLAFMEHMRLTTEAVDKLAQMAAGIQSGPPGAPSGAAPGAPPVGNAPPGAAPGGAPPADPAAQLTPGDRASAGQAA